MLQKTEPVSGSVQTVAKVFLMQETAVTSAASGDVGLRPLEIRRSEGDMCGRRLPIPLCMQDLCIGFYIRCANPALPLTNQGFVSEQKNRVCKRLCFLLGV